MNIIILSNEATPIFAQKDEEPTSEKNNQFFVYTLHIWSTRRCMS